MTTTGLDRPLADDLADVLATAPLEELAEAKAWLLARGQPVTRPAIATAVLGARARERRWATLRTQRGAFLAGLDADRTGPRLAALVDRCLERTGKAPTWREVGRVMGWSEAETSWAIAELRRLGWLFTGSEPRSLRPGRRFVNRQPMKGGR